MQDTRIINVDENNISQYGPTCFLNPKNEWYQKKIKWLEKRFFEGMKIKLLHSEKRKEMYWFY